MSGLGAVETEYANQFESWLNWQRVVRSSFCDRRATRNRTHACHDPHPRSRGSTVSLGPRLDDKCRQLNFRWDE